ncbi:MAG: hypothetical protein IJZ75_00460 [Clostridia bacterium]|nr:hypothetical protein [Clostridia bacterium]
MLFTRAEMEILRLCAWCMELPTRKTENLRAETVDELVWCGLLRVSRNKLSYRLTPYGYETLQKAGFEYSMDNAYRTDEHIVVRRHQGAEMALFFNRFGADVFVDTPRAERRKDFYVSAYSIRSASKGALLNNTQMIGFYYSGETMFVPYYVTKDDLGIYANVEQRNFNMQQVICGRKPFVVYTGANSLIEIAENVMTERCRNKKQTYNTYAEAFEKFECPIAIIPMNENGIRTMEVLKLKDYRTQIAKAVLGEDYLPPKSEHTDAISKSTGENYIVGIDCNIPRMKKAMELDTRAPNIIAFDYQVNTINKYCWGDVHEIDIAEVERVFRLRRKTEMKNDKAFQTKDGNYVQVPTEHMKTR